MDCETDSIVQKFIEEGFHIHPDAIGIIKQYGAPINMIENIINSLDDSVLVVSPDHVRPFQPRTDIKVKILKDITDISTCVGDYEEFVNYFRDRYERLSGILKKRISPQPIDTINRNGNGHGKNDVCVVGMVSDFATTTNGHKIITLDDLTGSCSVLLLKDKEVFDSNIILDEVIGITGFSTNDGLIIAKHITYPEIPITNSPNRSPVPSSAILTSDLHVGSDVFLEEAWERFVRWLNLDVGNEKQKAFAERIQYMVIAGDIVDGVGIYPNQEFELAITDIYDQYKRAAEHLAELPERIRIIISPGNHDAVRQAEPQPALPEEIRRLFKKNVEFIGNPSLIEISGIRILVYHGRSLEDLITSVPGASYDSPEIGMVEMLRRRHISPVYGAHVSIAPENTDHFVIETIPDIIHCGHVHTVGISKYRGVTLINSGTWQDQTDFQKRLNIKPDPAKVPIIDLQTMGVSVVRFI
ncbi:MAG: DNA-directed DNA polymerase II small subunit [Halobacteriota archaeon]|nr:DNA-directed DNA polymerase II small subunit [Halobacteriota archaeon]